MSVWSSWMCALALAAVAAVADKASVSRAEAVSTAAHVDVQVRHSAATESVLYTRVVEDGQSCGVIAGQLSMCASPDYVCRMEVGKEMYATAPSCLPYDPIHERDSKYALEETAAAPWSDCDAMEPRYPGDTPACQREFRCMCRRDGCRCVPPDAVASSGGSSRTSACADENDCPDGEYCKYSQAGGTTCGQKPYFRL